MKQYKLAFLFTQPPFGSGTSREGLDALLAASAFCDEDDIAICFLHDGLFNLIAHQHPETILQKDHISTFKLLELYELNHCFACKQSAQTRGLNEQSWILSHIQWVEQAEIFRLLQQAEKVMRF